MSHRYVIVFTILTLILTFGKSPAQKFIVNNHWSHPEEMEEGESVGIDVMQYQGEILTFIADGGNGLVVLAENDEGDLSSAITGRTPKICSRVKPWQARMN